MSRVNIISTIPPYAPYIKNVASRDVVGGVRLNTIMPIKGSLDNMLARLISQVNPKDIWIDLKCRQIRIEYGHFFKSPTVPKKYGIDGQTYILAPDNAASYGRVITPPWAEIHISHEIELDTSTPIKCYFSDGQDSAHIVEVIGGNTLIMLDGPKRVVGGGESINIPHSSLKIKGYFTETDYKYIEACQRVGIHNYMVSYVEEESDITELLKLDPNAQILAKIESAKGVDWVKNIYPSYKDKVNLMAARGDLYVEMGRPDKILQPLKEIIKADPNAVLASRLLPSLLKSSTPTCSDITDIACMLEMGYKSFMVGDDICFQKELLLLALDIIEAIGKDYIP